jgi:hypothetical protein
VPPTATPVPSKTPVPNSHADQDINTYQDSQHDGHRGAGTIERRSTSLF